MSAVPEDRMVVTAKQDGCLHYLLESERPAPGDMKNMHVIKAVMTKNMVYYGSQRSANREKDA
jgi:hypothetical protein